MFICSSVAFILLLAQLRMDKPAQDRKRKASTALRALAEDLQVQDRGRIMTCPEYEARPKSVVADINANLNVEGLCYGLPKRLDKLIASGGGRLKE